MLFLVLNGKQIELAPLKDNEQHLDRHLIRCSRRLSGCENILKCASTINYYSKARLAIAFKLKEMQNEEPI